MMLPNRLGRPFMARARRSNRSRSVSENQAANSTKSSTSSLPREGKLKETGTMMSTAEDASSPSTWCRRSSSLQFSAIWGSTTNWFPVAKAVTSASRNVPRTSRKGIPLTAATSPGNIQKVINRARAT